MGRTSSNAAYQIDPEMYDDQYSNGLLGRLQAMMQQGQIQPGADSGSPRDGESSYDGPPGGLLGRMLALQAEQNLSQQFAASDEPMASKPRDPNFRRLARVYITGHLQDGSDSSNETNGQSTVGSSPGSLHTPLQDDQAVRSDRSLSDRIQAYWDHPHPYGLVSVLKSALNGVAQSVQSSIDATTEPSTEENVFRQNQGHELGPIGALKAVSLLMPTTPAATGRMFALPLINALRNGPASLPASARVAGYGASRPIVAGLEDRFPAAMKLLRDAGNGNLPGVIPSLSPSRTGAATLSFQNSMSLPPLTGGRLFGPYGEKALPEWLSALPTMNTAQPGLPRRGTLIPPMTPVPLPPIYMQANPHNRGVSCIQSRKASTIRRGGGDDDDVCEQRKSDEIGRCVEREHEYAATGMLQACVDRAIRRWDLCNRNGGRIPRFEPPEWSTRDEDEWINVDR